MAAENHHFFKGISVMESVGPFDPALIAPARYGSGNQNRKT